MPKLKGYTTFTHPDTGVSQTVGPNDDLPEWVNEKELPKHLLEGADDENAPIDPEALSIGPGQTEADLTDEQKVEARKEADRIRKANARAAAKREKEQADAVAAAQKAEEERRAEAERLAAEEAAKQQAGGGS